MLPAGEQLFRFNLGGSPFSGTQAKEPATSLPPAVIHTLVLWCQYGISNSLTRQKLGKYYLVGNNRADDWDNSGARFPNLSTKVVYLTALPALCYVISNKFTSQFNKLWRLAQNFKCWLSSVGFVAHMTLQQDILRILKVFSRYWSFHIIITALYCARALTRHGLSSNLRPQIWPGTLFVEVR